MGVKNVYTRILSTEYIKGCTKAWFDLKLLSKNTEIYKIVWQIKWWLRMFKQQRGSELTGPGCAKNDCRVSLCYKIGETSYIHSRAELLWTLTVAPIFVTFCFFNGRFSFEERKCCLLIWFLTMHFHKYANWYNLGLVICSN
jgi:hypothetical protein